MGYNIVPQVGVTLFISSYFLVLVVGVCMGLVGSN